MTTPAAASETPRKHFLNTFVAPKPAPKLIGALTHINRWVNLYGIPGLRDVPYLNRLPLVRGLCDIRQFDWPEADQQRLQASVHPHNACFITPNHPEFFTDWMIDKELSSRVAPMMANWATHDIVNGMGRLGQKFWLANHLIAQVPGDTEAALNYSIATAAAGTPVLLHPEGSVLWQGDTINPLFQGAAQMALTLARAQPDKPVLLAPVLWKLVFIKDEKAALHAEMAHVEGSLGIEQKPYLALPLRLARLHRSVLAQRFEKLGFAPERQLSFFAARQVLLEKTVHSLREFGEYSGSLEEQAQAMIKAIRQQEKQGHPIDRMTALRRKELQLMLRTPQSAYQHEHWSQEHIAECLKRLRCDYVRYGSWQNKLHQFVPRPVGGRRAIIRVPAAIDVQAALRAQADLSPAELTERLRQTMQTALDEINAGLRQSGHPYPYANPFDL